MNEILEGYKRYLQDLLQRKPLTVYQYLQVAKQYFAFCEDNPRWSRTELIGFLSSKKGAWASKRWEYCALRKLYKHLEKPWPIDTDDLPKRGDQAQVVASIDQVERMLELAKKTNTQHYAVLRMSGATGMRKVELRNLLVTDFQPPHITVDTAKGGNPRQRWIDDETIQAVQQHLRLRQDKSPYLFSIRGKQLSQAQAAAIFNKYRKVVGFPARAGYHSFRRFFVTTLYDRGMREKEIDDLIGWKSPMAHRYIKLDRSAVEEKARAIHPLGSM